MLSALSKRTRFTAAQLFGDRFANGCHGSVIFAVALLAAFTHPLLYAAAPVLFQQSAYQSPVRGEPDDLLLLAGDGFTSADIVVYQATCKTAQQPSPPPSAPPLPTAESGFAPVVSAADTPHSLVIKLPEQMRSGQSYVIWVRNELKEWSNAVFINDARPLWLSPSAVFETADVGRPRYLKVIGRNLQPRDNSVTQVRLIGAQTITLNATINSAHQELNHFVAYVDLPQRLPVGEYRVEVKRDGCNWTPLQGQVLQVRADQSPPRKFLISDPLFGDCHADDAVDDSVCFNNALLAAKAAGTGTIVLSKGSWIIGRAAKGAPVVVPEGINVRGEGPDKTIILNRTPGMATGPDAMLTLSGRNEVSGILFRDDRLPTERSKESAAIRLGLHFNESRQGNALGYGSSVVDIAITDNVFDRVDRAIVDSGRSIRNLTITRNVFGAYVQGIDLGGNRFSVLHPFRIDDAIISFNTFEPSSYLDVPRRLGPIATEMGAGYHVDFSNNVADGSATRFLHSSQDAKGWRAAFFWHMNNNSEMLLVSENTASCTGDKIGDGEAIAFDNNANTFAFDEPKVVHFASNNTVTVVGLPLKFQNGREVPLDSYYVGHYIQIGDGPGIGQVRPIRSYVVDVDTGHTTFSVSPNWDVIPVKNSSRISVGREFWQMYTVANTVDHRMPLCAKSNRSAKKGGSIGIAGQTADSAIEGNKQYDSDGIIFHGLFSARDSKCADCNRGTNYLSFVEIRGNEILGEYDWVDGCSSSGIFGSLAASPAPISAPTTVGYGISISHNSIARADGWRGGAIALTPTWHIGPTPFRWPLVVTTLVHHNSINELSTPIAKPCRNDKIRPRIGINLGESSLARHTVLYSNSCRNTARRVTAGSQSAIRVCPATVETSCECASNR